MFIILSIGWQNLWNFIFPCECMLIFMLGQEPSFVILNFFFPHFRCVQLFRGASCTPVSWKKNVFCIDFLHISLDKSQKIKGGHILLWGQNSRSLFWTLFWELSSNVNKEYICSYLYLTICGACDQGFRYPNLCWNLKLSLKTKFTGWCQIIMQLFWSTSLYLQTHLVNISDLIHPCFFFVF